MATLRERFFKHIAQTSDAPPALEFIRAESNYLIDRNGRKHLDLIAGISVSNLGHHKAEVVEAIKKQADQHLHLMVYGEFVVTPQVELAGLLVSNLPASLSTVYFTNSGAEAVEGALKVAKRFTGRTEMVSFRNSYHGSTHGALSVTGDPELQRAYRPLLPDVLHLDYGNESQLQQITDRTACVIIEPVQAEAGCMLPPAGYLQALRKRCTETGTLLIFDEIQTGMFRTGTLFAFQREGTVPDILLTGKAFGGGMPLGAFIASSEIMSVISNNPVLGHITTFGGHPVCCAAGMASLQVLLREQGSLNIEGKESRFREKLKDPQIISVSGKGLLLAVKFRTATLNQEVIRRCMEKGVITDWFLFAPDCLRIAPPLTITLDEIDHACHTILASINH